ncbi:MAG TPA: CbtA family protein [Dongiaceae bacterium]|jgi:cobalt transporter subunit CbtA|nr:CbtA family protein [Dongiaceae bacterium]
MESFRRYFLAALFSGLIAGAILAAFHITATTPLILQAERFEQAEQVAEWQPQDGFERGFYTAAADLLLGVGYGAVLIGFFVMLDWPLRLRHGLLWGVTFFAALSAAPSLGLPPELPGSEAAPLLVRQGWWIATAILTFAGLASWILMRHWRKYPIGLLLLAAPHIIGAPQAPETLARVPLALRQHFALLSVGGNLLFWIVLGLAGTFIFNVLKEKTDASSRFIGSAA